MKSLEKLLEKGHAVRLTYVSNLKAYTGMVDDGYVHAHAGSLEQCVEILYERASEKSSHVPT